MEVLSTRTRNRALLDRQLLLERHRLAIPEALDRIGGIQAQYAPSMYVGLGSRLEGFRRDELTAALEDRSVVQGTIMRSTIHLVSRADYWPLTVAVRAHRRAWWVRASRSSVEEMEAIGRAVKARLVEGPTRRAELDDIADKRLMTGVHLFADIVRVPPSGTWNRRRADLFGDAESWVGPEPDLAEHDAVRHLVRRYLGGFGPASVAAIASWGGLPITTVRAAIEAIDTVRYQAESGEELVDLPGHPLPDADVPAPARLLPTWDATLLAHARGTGVLDEDDRSRIFTTKNPQSVSTFMVDGTVAGAWRHDRDSGRIVLEPFRPLPARARKAVEAEADRMLDLLG